MKHLVELVGGAHDGAVMEVEPVVERLCCAETREVHVWDGAEPVPGIDGQLRRFVFVREGKEA